MESTTGHVRVQPSGSRTRSRANAVEVGSSPTKIGGCLAAGLPIVAADISDVKDLLLRSGTGVVLDGFSQRAYRLPANEVAAMLATTRIGDNCIAAAEGQLSLSAVGLPRYEALYRFVAGEANHG